jgi:hypothetical protein
MVDGRAARQRTLARVTASRISYAVTLEPHGKPWLFALDFPASLPQPVGDEAGERPDTYAFVTRDQQLIARSSVSQVQRYTQLSVLRDELPGRRGRRSRLPAPAVAREPAHARARPRARAKHVDDAGRRRGRARLAALAAVRLHAHAAAARPRPGRHVPVRDAARLLRALRGRLRGADARGRRAARVVTGYQGGEVNPRGLYLIVRQSDAHAWTEVLVDGQWRRIDPTAVVAPSRIEMGMSRAVGADEPVPLFARLEGGWLKGAQLAFDAVNHAWRRNLVGFDRQRQRELWRELTIDRFAGWQIAAIAGALGLAWAGACWRSRVSRAPSARASRRCGSRRARGWRARACRAWRTKGRSLTPRARAAAGRSSRSRSPRSPSRTRRCATARRPCGPGEREALVATLARAVDVLPPPSQLRSAAA